MACALTSAQTLGCRDNTGGIKKFYATTYSAGTYTYDSTGTITGGTGSITANTWYTIEQRLEQGEFKLDAAISDANGTVFYTPSVTMTFYKYQASVRDLIYTLATGNFRIIVLDQNGKYFLLNEGNYASASTETAGTGKAFGDLNGSIVTITGKEITPCREISSTYFSSLNII